MENGDAKNVIALHTNKNAYGFKSVIGPNDKNIHGGNKQPNCKVNVDKCSHEEAWNAFSQFLREKIVTIEKSRVHPFVICLDVSLSMRDKNRLVRALHSAQQVISNLKSELLMGIVTFDGEARKVHDVIKIQGVADKKSLLASLPKTADGVGTSIGAGLRVSMNTLQAMSNSSEFCSTIVLISDGEQNSNESPSHVLKELQNACIKVSSIGLGKQASDELENLSTQTGGEVFYSMEDGTSQEISGTMRVFSYLFESETDKDNLPVHLPSKHVSLTNNGEDVVNFMIDENSGRDTEFKFVSYHLDKVDLKLRSPDGDEFSAESSEYFYDPNIAKGFRIPYAEPGQWNITVRKMSHARRSVRSVIDGVVTGTTYSPSGKETIRLNGIVSNRTLEYPKSITITAELQIGEFPIIHAELLASIQAPGHSIIYIQLMDNGVFPDELANDGVYTNDVIKLPTVERYSVLVTAKSNGTAMLVQKKINYLLKDVVDCEIESVLCKKLNQFERETELGSIKLLSNDKIDQILPHPVNDLSGMMENEK